MRHRQRILCNPSPLFPKIIFHPMHVLITVRLWYLYIITILFREFQARDSSVGRAEDCSMKA